MPPSPGSATVLTWLGKLDTLAKVCICFVYFARVKISAETFEAEPHLNPHFIEQVLNDVANLHVLVGTTVSMNLSFDIKPSELNKDTLMQRYLAPANEV